ncbi:MAG TPA: CDP-alcohol phosphatidyltransferase family protein [Motilibacterales bacterium]|nr:CDP-alcohol phosphatidyltransferase family protein [Motilibacterales bacterium]
MLNNADARGVLAPVVEPIARGLLRMRITPDMVTLAGTTLTVLTALILIPQGRFIPAVVLLFLFISADVLDGTMARLSGTQGPWGAWFDATLDRVADGAVFGGVLIWAAWHSDTLTTMLAWVCLVGGVVVSYAKARAEAVGATANGGIAERAERIILLGLGAILYQFVAWGMSAAIAILAVLTVITVFQRGLDVRSQLKPLNGQQAAAPSTEE